MLLGLFFAAVNGFSVYGLLKERGGFWRTAAATTGVFCALFVLSIVATAAINSILTNQAELAAWNNPPPFVIDLYGGVVGAILGATVARRSRRARSDFSLK